MEDEKINRIIKLLEENSTGLGFNEIWRQLGCWPKDTFASKIKKLKDKGYIDYNKGKRSSKIYFLTTNALSIRRYWAQTLLNLDETIRVMKLIKESARYGKDKEEKLSHVITYMTWNLAGLFIGFITSDFLKPKSSSRDLMEEYDLISWRIMEDALRQFIISLKPEAKELKRSLEKASLIQGNALPIISGLIHNPEYIKFLRNQPEGKGKPYIMSNDEFVKDVIAKPVEHKLVKEPLSKIRQHYKKMIKEQLGSESS